jgi:hypothetical protein
MPQGLAGPGQNLPSPQALYPASLYNAPFQPATNRITLPPGEALPIPPNPYGGGWLVSSGSYGIRQYFNPVTLTWDGFSTALATDAPLRTPSDGFNYRIANLTGCPVAAIVTSQGSVTYAQATTSVVAAAGGSTWQAIVGGAINTTVTSVTSIVAGGGYTIAPLVFIPTPPPPGVAATAVASISSNSVSTVTMINQGAGYTSAPPMLLLPSPFDPNYLAGTVTQSSITTLTLTGTGVVTGVLCTNNGTQQGATMPSLTITGAGSGALATVVPMWTVASNSIAAIGAGYASGNNGVLSFGGIPTAVPFWKNPQSELTNPIPRAFTGYATLTGTTITTIVAVDSGLFFGTPSVLAFGGTTLASIVPTVGGTNTTVLMQPT